MTARERLPNRRASESFAFTCNDLKHFVTISRYEDGRLAEVFIGNAKAGLHSDVAAKDAAVICSIALQYGVPVDVIRKALLHGVTYALELKSEGGRLSENQLTTHEAMKAAGAVVGVAVGLDEALRWLEEHHLLTGRTQCGDADDWRRLWQELAAAPTRAAAVDVFESYDRLFLGLNCAEREQRYAAVEGIVREKPDPKNSHS